MEEKKRRGRPPKSAAPVIVPSVSVHDKKKFPLNPDPDITMIRRLVVDCMQLINEPKKPDDLFGADYSRKYGYCERTIKQIAEELGVLE